MLKLLNISNIAVINKLLIEFESGLHLLTGETGSGKSIIIDSLNLLLGARASQDLIRTGQEVARVEGLFTTSPHSPASLLLQNAGIAADEGEILIRRELSSAGKSKIFINDSPATLGLLREIAGHLVDIHGQHDNQALLDPEFHLDLLDWFEGNESLLTEIRDQHDAILRVDAKLKSLRMDEQQRLKRIDMLAFQISEIERAKLTEGLEKELAAERYRLVNGEKVFTLAAESYEMLYNAEPSLLTVLKKVMRHAQDLAQIDPVFIPYLEPLENLEYQLEDLSHFLRSYSEQLDFSEERLNQLETRCAEVEKLCKKYGPTTSEVLTYLTKIRAEHEALAECKEHEAEFSEQLNQLLTVYQAKAAVLSKRRARATVALESGMKAALRALAMETTAFKVRMQTSAAGGDSYDLLNQISARGLDQVEFMVATNKGEALKPLVKVASGGELSRIILAIKSLIAADSPDKTLIFDEVDSGIGGRVAEVVGRRLRDVARRNQVICVTHLPQVAAFADEHYFVGKRIIDRRTEAYVERMQGPRRVEEIARMLGGEKITETTTKHAREMLQLAEAGKGRS